MSTGQEKGHANHTMRGLRYPRQSLELVGVFPLQVLACFCLVQQIINFSSISDLAYEKQL